MEQKDRYKEDNVDDSKALERISEVQETSHMTPTF